MKILLAIVLLIFSVACSEDDGNQVDQDYNEIEKLVPSDNFDQQQKDAWRPNFVAMDAIDESILQNCEIEECDKAKAISFLNAKLLTGLKTQRADYPDFSECYYDVDEDGGFDNDTRTRTVIVRNAGCPVRLSYIKQEKIEIGDESFALGIAESLDVGFKSAAGWPITFDLVGFKAKSSFAGSGVIISDFVELRAVRGRVSYTLERANAGDNVEIKIGMAGEFKSSDGFDSEYENFKAAIVIQGRNINFGGTILKSGNSFNYTINNKSVSKFEFASVFGEMDLDN